MSENSKKKPKHYRTKGINRSAVVQLDNFASTSVECYSSDKFSTIRLKITFNVDVLITDWSHFTVLQFP